MKIKEMVEYLVDELEWKANNDGYGLLNLEKVDAALHLRVLDMASKKAKTYICDDMYTDDEIIQLKNKYYVDLSIKMRNLIANRVSEMMETLGFDCYEGDFFPCNGYFKSLAQEQIAFIK